MDYEKKINQNYSEKNYSQGQNKSATNNPERKNNTVVINIPDSISLSGVKAYLQAFSSKIKPLFIRVFKIIFYIVIAVILFNLFLTYIKNSNSYNTAADLSDAQQEVQDAVEELNESDLTVYAEEQAIQDATEELNESEDYPYIADTSESIYNDISEVQQASIQSYTTHAPNGQLFPSSAGYVAGYPQLNSNGASTLTIDNSKNAEAIFGKLYYLDSIEPQAVRHFYIPGGGGLNLRNISAGNYDVRYKDLESGYISKSESLPVEEYEEYDGLRFSEITITLYKVSNGNMETYSIPESEF